MELFKSLSYKMTVVHTFQPHDSASRISFCNWFSLSVNGSEVDSHFALSYFILFFDEACTTDSFMMALEGVLS